MKNYAAEEIVFVSHYDRLRKDHDEIDLCVETNGHEGIRKGSLG